MNPNPELASSFEMRMLDARATAPFRSQTKARNCRAVFVFPHPSRFRI